MCGVQADGGGTLVDLRSPQRNVDDWNIGWDGPVSQVDMILNSLSNVIYAKCPKGLQWVNSRKRWRSRWKLSQEIKWKVISFLAEEYTDGRSVVPTYQLEANTYLLFVCEMEDECKIIKNNISDYRNMFLAPICLDGQKDCSQEHS